MVSWEILERPIAEPSADLFLKADSHIVFLVMLQFYALDLFQKVSQSVFLLGLTDQFQGSKSEPLQENIMEQK